MKPFWVLVDRGTVVQGVLMNPVTGVEIPLDNVPEKIQINMVIENYTVPEGKRMKVTCRMMPQTLKNAHLN